MKQHLKKHKILHFPNVPCTQTCLPTWYQVRFYKFFGGKGAVPGTVPLLRNKNLRIQTCLRGWYQVRFFGLIFGHSWGNGEGPGWHLVRYLCETRKALHERHVWKPLKDPLFTNMKPQTERETTASRSFIGLGSTISPRHEAHPT